MSNISDERMYIGLRDSLGYTNEMVRPGRNDSKLKLTIEIKIRLTKKIALRLWGYTNSKYLYMLHDGSLMLKYKIHTTNSLDHALEA